MKIILLSIFVFVSLNAGKVTWSESGNPIIAGTAGQGCSQNAFGLEDKNTTKPNCS